MPTAKPRTLTSAGFAAQLTSLRNSTGAFHQILRDGAEQIRQEAVRNTPAFDPEMRAGWQLVETGSIGSDRYTVSVVNTSPRATTPLAFEGVSYLSPEGKPYTLLDVYDKGTRKAYTIAPRNKDALAFFWVKAGRIWDPRPGQTTTHPGLPEYETLTKTQEFAAKIAADIRASFRGNLRATLRGRGRRFNRP